MAPDNPDALSDTFTSSDTYSDTPNDNLYPKPLPLAPISWLFGYTESDRQRYLRSQLENTERLLNLQLTAHERSGLAYYDSIFYTYESFGDTFGTTTGLAVGYMFRNRKPGLITNGFARLFGQGGNPKAVKFIGVGLKLLTFGVAGRMYGITSTGLQALNRMRTEQKADLGMARIVKARAAKLGALEREARHKILNYPAVDGTGDEQSLGGIDIADQFKDGEVVGENRVFPFGRPSEKVVELEREEPCSDDPFFETEPKSAEKPPQIAWQNTYSSTAESTWERLRRGQIPSTASPDATRASPWPPRAPMKGFGDRSTEPKTDSFSFAGSGEERELARVQAQKEFDESVERERRSAGGDAYSEDDKEGRGWRD